jgi:cell shape-determining protein MreC
MISPRGPWLDDLNHQVTRLARQLTDQLQQVPDVEQEEERTKRKGNSQIKWLNRLLKLTSDDATLLESVASVRRQLPW